MNAIEKYGVIACDLLTRHLNGDWGDIPPEDWHANDASEAMTGDKIMRQTLSNTSLHTHTVGVNELKR